MSCRRRLKQIRLRSFAPLQTFLGIDTSLASRKLDYHCHARSISLVDQLVNILFSLFSSQIIMRRHTKILRVHPK